MSQTITIPFTDDDCRLVMTAWLSSSAGTRWCCGTIQSYHQNNRYSLIIRPNLVTEADWDILSETRTMQRDGDGVIRPLRDLVPATVREGLASMLVGDGRSRRRVAAATIADPGYCSGVHADLVVQTAVFGRVVF